MPPVDMSHQIDMCVHANDSTANRSVPLGGIVNNLRKLTAEVILGYISCKYKAYLMLSGTLQAPGPYEEWFRVQDEEYRSRCIQAINDRTNKSLPLYVNVNGDTYQVEAAIAETRVDDDIFSLNFDVLRSMKKETPSVSKYIP